MAKHEHKAFAVSEVKVAPDESGEIEALVSVLNNIDSGGEIVMPGFFTDSIKKKLPKGVWGHEWTAPIARTLIAEEWLAGDARLPEHLKNLGAYYIKAQFNLDTQRGRDAYSDIKFGIIDEFSIGYSVQKDRFNKERGARELIKGEWFEWSPVLVGMNRETALLSVKEGKHVPEQNKQAAPPARSIKGAFEDALAERTNNLYALFDVLCMCLWQAQYADEMSEDLGATFDLAGAVDEILAEFSARVRASVLEEDTEEDSGVDDMRELGMASLDAGKALKGGAVSASPFDKKSFAVVSAVSGLTRHSAEVKSFVDGWLEQSKQKHELRVKDGRTISQANRDRMAAAQEKIKACVEAMKDVHGDLGGLIEMANPVEKASPEAVRDLIAKMIHTHTVETVRR